MKSVGVNIQQYLTGLARFASKPGLARITYLLEKADHPEQKYPIIHVVGTNGKGSTAAFMAAILRAAGLRVGLYTSPHLIYFNERIQINGTEITDAELQAVFDSIYPWIRSAAAEEGVGHPTQFEVTTALALVYFARENVDLAILEAGLGGRLDATHVGRPVVTVITHIDLDHTEVLGDSLSLIAAEKAGVIPPGGTVVVAPQADEAKKVIRQVAAERKARFIDVEKEYETTFLKPSPSGTDFVVTWKEQYFSPGLVSAGDRSLQLRIGMLGLHQVTNAITAVAAIEALREHGITIDDVAIKTGLATARWPGRLEVIGSNPAIILDGAHNLDGFRQLRRALPLYFTWQKLHFIISVVGEKPVNDMLKVLLPLGDTVIFTVPQASRSRPVSPHVLAHQAGGLIARVEEAPNWETAYKRVRNQAAQGDLICVCGSLYLVGEARRHLLFS